MGLPFSLFVSRDQLEKHAVLSKVSGWLSPNSQNDENMDDDTIPEHEDKKRKRRQKKKYFAVARGMTPGIYTSYEGFKNNTKCEGSIWQICDSQTEAEDFIKQYTCVPSHWQLRKKQTPLDNGKDVVFSVRLSATLSNSIRLRAAAAQISPGTLIEEAFELWKEKRENKITTIVNGKEEVSSLL